MIEQVARMPRLPVRGKISGRGGRGEALRARADRYRDHVLLQPLAVADAGVAAGGEHIDEAVIGDHFETDVGIGREKTRHDCRQNQSRHHHRHIQAQHAGRPFAELIDDIERGFDFVQRRRQPVEQTCACFGRADAAGGAVEQPYTQPGFEPPHRLAQRRRAGAAAPRTVAETARLGDSKESVQVGEVGLHCPEIRTGHPDCDGLSDDKATVRSGPVSQENRS